MKVHTLYSKDKHRMVSFVVSFYSTDEVTIDYVFTRDHTEDYTNTRSLEDARRIWKYFMVDLGYTRN